MLVTATHCCMLCLDAGSHHIPCMYSLYLRRTAGMYIDLTPYHIICCCAEEHHQPLEDGSAYCIIIRWYDGTFVLLSCLLSRSRSLSRHDVAFSPEPSCTYIIAACSLTAENRVLLYQADSSLALSLALSLATMVFSREPQLHTSAACSLTADNILRSTALPGRFVLDSPLIPSIPIFSYDKTYPQCRFFFLWS